MGKEKQRESDSVLLDLILQITKCLIEKGFDKELAVTTATEAAQFVSRHWNGSSIYFSTKKLAIKLLESELAENFDGSRDQLVALARKHNVTGSCAYEILKRVRQRLQSSHQN